MSHPGPNPSGPAHRLRHVRWIGGGSGAGKSTVAARLAAEHGLHLYDTDAAMPDHVTRSTASDHPLLHAFLGMSMDQRWLNRPPAEMLATFHSFRGEAFELIVEDLLELPADPPILVEGFRLLPRLVAPLLEDVRQAVWLLPTPAFRHAALTSRGSLYAIAGRTSDPELALSNLLERDRLFTDELAQEATDLGLQVIRADVGMEIAALAAQVAVALGLEGASCSTPAGATNG